MRIARFALGDDITFGVLDEDAGDLIVIQGDPLFTAPTPTGRRVALDDARLLAPVIPRSKIIGVGRNYAAHAAEMGNDLPEVPLLFLKPNTAVVGPGDPIVLPDFTSDVQHEAELAVVIGRLAKDVPEEQAMRVVAGFTAANDVSARDRQRAEPQWVRAKGFDTSCPLGPYLVTDLDVADLAVRARVNGELRQDGRTRDLIFSIPQLIAFISHAFTLLPGDVILTGTPAGVGPLVAGDRVEVEVEGIGVLANPVRR